MTTLLHVTTPEAWAIAARSGEYRGDTLATEGFIHCANPGQLAGVLDRYFRGRAGLIVLKIDPDRVRPPIRWEAPPGSSETFPHIYGPLNLDAVVEVTPPSPTD